MKKILPLAVLFCIHYTSWSQRICGSGDYIQYLQATVPGLETARASIEKFTQEQLHKRVTVTTGTDRNRDGLAIITIPVVVHIIYNTPAQNISDAQVLSQLDVLNRDYRKKNPDTSGIPSWYAGLSADCGFQFVLAGLDTAGNPTTGIVRKRTNVPEFTVNDNIKFSATGGDDAWDRDRYLNIWVGNLSGGILGYSSILGCPKERDGVTILYTAFGTNGTATSPFNLGRTTTHEIGHWLNLIHVWGDAPCGNDEVDDTPPQQAADYGNPYGIIVSCGNGPYGNMYMNYMDFTNDIGMHMFTFGQRDRMRALFADGGFRNAILSSPAASVVALRTGSKGSLPGAEAGRILGICPNPASATATILLSDATAMGGLLEVYNQIGQRVMTIRVSGLNMPLNVSGLADGIYFVRIGGNRSGESARLIKISR